MVINKLNINYESINSKSIYFFFKFSLISLNKGRNKHANKDEQWIKYLSRTIEYVNIKGTDIIAIKKINFSKEGFEII